MALTPYHRITLIYCLGMLTLGVSALVGILLLVPVTGVGLLDWGDRLAQSPLATALVVVLMAATMSIGLAGSMCFWLVAPFYTPWLGTFLLLTGTLCGSLGAYWLGQRLDRITPHTQVGRRVRQLLTERNNLSSQIALRMLPAFPPTVINITSGVLHLPLGPFVLAIILGMGVKWGLYCVTVYNATEALQNHSPLDAWTLIPLGVLGVLMLIGGQLKHKGHL